MADFRNFYKLAKVRLPVGMIAVACAAAAVVVPLYAAFVSCTDYKHSNRLQFAASF
jgi:hypothetical protein